MTITVKAASAAQFLALVPRMLGYRPARSLVLIPFAGSRSLGAMRIDGVGIGGQVDAHRAETSRSGEGNEHEASRRAVAEHPGDEGEELRRARGFHNGCHASRLAVR